MRGAAVNAQLRQRGVNKMLEAITQSFDAGLGAVFQMLAREFGSFAESDDSRHVFRAAPSFVFLTTTHEQWRKTCALADIERPDALRRMHFVATEAEEIDGRCLHIEVDFSHRLHGIRMH